MSNPIIQRELTAALRAPITLALAALYLIVLGGLIVWMWPAEGVFSLAAQASRSLVLVFTVTQLLLVMMYAPAFAASSITSEKEQNTYDLLFATQLRPKDIILGKLWSSITTLWMFVVLSLPLFAACFFLGAVSVRETVVIYLVAVASSVFFGLLGLSVSAVVSTSHTALVTTYLLILLFNAGPWVPWLLLKDQLWAAELVATVRAVSPVAAMASVISPAHEGAAAWRLFLVFAVSGSAALTVFLLTTAYLTRGRPPRSHGRAITDPRELMKRKLHFPFYLIDPMRRKRNIPDWVNPMFAKEMRSKAFGGGIWIFRSAYLCFAVSMLLMAAVAGNLVGQTPDAIRAVALIFQLGLVVLIVPSLTAGAVTQERERASLDLLRLARIRPLAFLRGKLEVAAVFVMFLVIGSAPAWYVIYYLGTNTAQEILICWSLILATMVLAMAVGLWASAVSPRTAVATAVSYGVMFLIAVGTLLPLLMGERLGGAVRDVLFAINPFVSAIQTLTTGYFAEVGDLWRAHLTWSLGLSAVALLWSYERVRRMLGTQS